jgi:hypothetical protein
MTFGKPAPLADRPRFRYHRGRLGDRRMRSVWAVLIVVSLGLALGACSKCDVPDWLPKTCKTGTVPTPN